MGSYMKLSRLCAVTDAQNAKAGREVGIVVEMSE